MSGLQSVRALATAGVVSLALSFVAHAAPGETPSYSRDANDVVISYREILPIQGAQRGPTLLVYGDGRVSVSYPESLNRAGEHELGLSSDQLDALVRALARTDRLTEFDARQARERRRAAHDARTAQTGTETVQSDPTVIEIVLRCDGIEKRIRWSGLEFDDEQYGASLPEIHRLRAAQQRLRALLEAPELRRVR